MSKPVNGAAPTGPALKPGMTLDQALAVVTPSIGMSPVLDGDGKVIGTLDPERLTRALVASAE